MKNVSLMKITAMVVVVTVALASNFVNAEDKVNKTIAKAQSDVAELAKQLKFSSLIEKLDSDKNGMLSQTEVSTNQSQLLHDEFNKMDVNQDKQIDEAEFNSYFAEVKAKATDVVINVI